MKFAIAKQTDTSQNTRQQLNAKYEIISIHKNRDLANKKNIPNELPMTEIIKISDEMKRGDEIGIDGTSWSSNL